MATSPPVRARQVDEPIDSDAPTTSGTSMNALTVLLSVGQTTHVASATSPQKYCGLGCIVSRFVSLTASDGCVVLTSTSVVLSCSLVPSAYSKVAYTRALSPACVSDCSSSAEADVCEAALNAPLVTAEVRSSTSSTRALDALIRASATPATSTSCTPAAVGCRVRIDAS